MPSHLLHKKGFYPVLMVFLQALVRDRRDFFRHLEALAVNLCEPGQEQSREGSQGDTNLADGGQIQGGKAGIIRSRCWRQGRCVLEGWLSPL
jgi:hypothetical protein